MRIGIGLPAAVPGADMAQIGAFAARAEQAGFESVGVIDRLVYDNLDPLIALAAAAARTSRIRLISTVVNVNWRANPRLLAKQISSVVRVSGGRFTAGLGMGGWPADYEASDIPPNGPGKRFAAALTVMDEAWRSPGARPSVVLGSRALSPPGTSASAPGGPGRGRVPRALLRLRLLRADPERHADQRRGRARRAGPAGRRGLH